MLPAFAMELRGYMCTPLQVTTGGSDSDGPQLQWPSGSKKRRSRSRSLSRAGSAATTPAASCGSLGPEASTGSVKRQRTGPRAVVWLRRDLAAAAERHRLQVQDLAALAALQPMPLIPDDVLADIACEVCTAWLAAAMATASILFDPELLRQETRASDVKLLSMCGVRRTRWIGDGMVLRRPICVALMSMSARHQVAGAWVNPELLV